ncbi:hypothetical protein NVP1016O_48 [Vibrio phage 1.016.O._10N.286.46.A11]|nr:hypothetical protein NVP1016O_48 [Vibrio phage 1.016.O._10N.286.46.A11]AUR85278.1 hypothetical protein NVP1071A_48 [Vibrio phage 1.071.A._10N.286.46.A12]
MIRNQINGEIVTSGDHFLYDQTAISKSVVRRVKTFYGEYFLDRTDGTRMLNGVLGKTSEVEREQELRRRILTTDGVLAITQMSITQDIKRKVSVSVTIATPFGQNEIVESF